MKINIKVKQAGRKHPVFAVEKLEIAEIGDAPALADLLKAVVAAEVAAYNRKTPEKNLLEYLTRDEIEQRAESGKVGFGSIYNENKADLDEAQATALQAFEDGIFSVFADDVEIRNLKDEVRLGDSTVITFIRLTFLAGSCW